MTDTAPGGSYLVVDDDEFQLDLMCAVLQRLGAESVRRARDGAEALRELDGAEQPLDLLLLDLQMPGMDGIELLRHLAERAYEGSVVLLSGEDPRILEAALQLAATQGLKVLGALQKPLTADALKGLRAQPANSPSAWGRATAAVTADDLARALSAREISLHYQPKVALTNDTPPAAECLVRWEHSQHGFIPPGIFVALAEKSPLIDALTDRVIQLSIEQAGAWKAQGFEPKLSINLSMDNLHQFDLPERLSAVVKDHGIDPGAITLEVTESRLIADLSTTLDILTRFRLRGFPLSIDDFGTGYSSLAQLSSLPFTELKIERAFVHGAHQDERRHAILEASIGMAQKLKLKTVAEGVEDEADLQVVAALGCDLVQGYFISRPLSADAFRRWAAEWKGLPPQVV